MRAPSVFRGCDALGYMRLMFIMSNDAISGIWAGVLGVL